ncbi:arginine--tRNA ligase [Paenibacillus harenae]|uniref:Arginine--tRNA ligase n=1 Tax=Paenibacillus harenae TaxID=306543 RepID=A0ABT9UAL0_PAEHA|nr:arginine--tRNA ligase [Paenibacillus harenae]MDQ0116675.1 arginyl-tRNA synthetase [Paenibacillus harenae]
MIKEQLTRALTDAVEQIVSESGLTPARQVNVVVEHPANEANGEFSSNVAMQLAKQLKRAPLAIASEVKEKLLGDGVVSKLFAKIDVAPPGFINFYVNWEQWAKLDASGTISPRAKMRQKVLIEHTSINPNKSAHIGHLRNSCIGDTLARLLKQAGHKVEVHNYIDDLGNQLADTVVGMLHTETAQTHARFGDYCWETYAKVNQTYKEKPELLQERARVLAYLEEGGNNIAWMGLLIAERIVREHVEEMRQFGIDYDVLVWESSIVSGGFWQRAFELLKQTDVFRIEQHGKLAGCWVLAQHAASRSEGEAGEAEEREQGDHQADKVLVRSNGILTYTAKDIAYHLWKFGLLDNDFRYRKFGDRLWSTHASGAKKKIGKADAVINVIDQRQRYPQEMVKQALVALGYKSQAEQLRHVSYGVVSLSPSTAAGLGVDTSDGKHAYPMSGRQGIGIKVSELLTRMEAIIDAKRSRKAGIKSRTIAAASIRYYLLRFHLQTEIVFDLEQATEISGNTGVYLLYAYARACSILEKAGHVGIQNPAEAHFGQQLEKQEHAVLRQLCYWPEALQAAESELAPNIVCNYTYELTTLFNHFYATCSILKAAPAQRQLRLWLTQRYKQTLGEALHILGMPAPTSM